MANHLLFSQTVVSMIRERFAESNGDKLYLEESSFATAYETIISPTIDEAAQLSNRVDPESDIETAIALFEAFQNLNALEASSVGFWTYLTHVDLWDYMRKRFTISLEMPEATRRKKIKEKWFLGEPSQGTLMRHPLAGLWWGVKLSQDPSRGEGRYDFTRILFRDLDLLTRTLGTYQLGRLPHAIRGILGYVFDHPDDFKSDFEAKMRYIMKHFNSIGGVVQLGCVDESFYREELKNSESEWISATRRVEQNPGNDVIEVDEGALHGEQAQSQDSQG